MGSWCSGSDDPARTEHHPNPHLRNTAIANSLTGLTPTIYESLDIVSRELIGFIPAVTKDTSAQRASVGQTILVPIAPVLVPTALVPGVTAPNPTDTTIGNVSMTISQSQFVNIRWNGEEQNGLINAGSYAGILRNQFAQGFRALTNLIDLNLFQTTYQNASRAVGTAGTTPFGTAGDLSDIAGLRRVLDDNGAPQSDLQFVAGGAAMQNMRGKQTVLFKVNEAGDGGALLRDGVIGRLEGFDLHNSGQVAQIVKGTGAGYVTSGSTAVGVGSIALVTGAGTVNAGDVVSFAADPNNKYVNNSGISGPGTINLGAPGVLATIATGNAVTVGANYTPNMGFSKSAVMLITRPPLSPIGPDGKAMDMADDTMLITDPVSGITFEIAVYRQFMQLVYQIRVAWGYQAIKPNHIATLMG